MKRAISLLVGVALLVEPMVGSIPFLPKNSSYSYTVTKYVEDVVEMRPCASPRMMSSVVNRQDVSDFSFDEGEDGWLLTEYRGSSSSVTIPSEVQGKPVVEIGSAFRNCTYLKSVSIPSSVTEIGSDAFLGCSGLTSITIPNSVTKIESWAFANCSSLSKVALSSSLRSIGSSAFANDSKLEYINLGDNVTSIGSDCFKGCNDLRITTNFLSDTVVYCIDNGIDVLPSASRGKSQAYVDRLDSLYYCDTMNISASGNLLFSIKFCTGTDWVGKLQNKQIVIFVPRSADLDLDSIKMDGSYKAEFSYTERTRRLTIKVPDDSCQISFCANLSSTSNILSYAYFTGTYNGNSVKETIGTINDSFSGISINAPEISSGKEVKVTGLAKPESSIDLYVDGVKKSTVVAKKNGTYSGKVLIDDPVDYYQYTIMARGKNAKGNSVSAVTYVEYHSKAPYVTSLVLQYYDGNTPKRVDLINTNGTKPLVYYAPSKEYRFEIGFENRGNLDSVFVTSTRGNEKKSMEAKYDAGSGKYVASGFFDPNNKSYVPGDIRIEYNEKHEETKLTADFNFDPYKKIINSSNQPTVNISKKTDTDLEATIDWSKVTGDMGKGLVKAGVKYIDTAHGTSVSDLLDDYDIAETALKYIIPGDDGNKYALHIDLTDDNTAAMLLYDMTDTGLTVLDKVVSAKIDLTDFGSDKYYALLDAQDTIGNLSMAANFGYSMYGIYSDTSSLLKEIDQSNTISDKATARKKAFELASDRIAFTAMMTALPLLVAGAGMAGPALIFSGLLCAMKATSSFFWDARVSQIKGEKYRPNWVVDPSGYVYDAQTNARLQDVTVSAYWIPYDGKADFYKNVPGTDQYGTLWNASEYEQMNPLQSSAEGKYAWDVPEGWWRVKFEKEGYETTWSEWMTVPPIQTDVNIGMNSLSKPTFTPTPKPTTTPVPTKKLTPTPTGKATPVPTKQTTPKPTEKVFPTPTPTRVPSVADFAERLYTVALNRASEPEGKKYWVDEITSGNKTGGECAYFFLIEAKEFKNRGLSTEAFVETLYQTFFDRASEPNGKAYWVGELKKGAKTREDVINGFIDSTEWCNICATYGVKSGAPNAKAEYASQNAINFATRLYTCCLGRDPEEKGLNYWSLALTNLEQTGFNAAKLFFTSEEFTNKKTSNEEFVTRLYTTFMDREPETAGFNYWVGELKKGKDRNEVLASFAQCQEFMDICKKYGIDRGTI